MADSKFLLCLIASLVISSILIALITGGSAISVTVDSSLQAENWVAGNNLTKGIDYYDGNFGGFLSNENGLVSSLPFTNDVRFTKAEVDEGIYRHKYTLTKNGINYFGIIIRDTGYNSDTLILEFTPGELTLRNNNAMGLLIPNSYQQTLWVDTYGDGDDVLIVETVYDITEKTVNVYIDNIQVALYTDVPEKSVLSVIKPTYYGGVTVRNSGFEINAYETNSHMGNSGTGFDLFAFLNTLAGILVWYVSPDLPDSSTVWYPLSVIGDTFINIIIKIQQIGIVAYG
ncbi:MAG: hypothetical protein PHV87_06995, partial [Bacilli bacterium]|nr:hypothetical protein [Bacilli bacterium]